MILFKRNKFGFCALNNHSFRYHKILFQRSLLFSMALALGVGKDKDGKSSFEHILRQEAKFDADFLFSLDFFEGKMVRNN